jgi:hypothetical protein
LAFLTGDACRHEYEWIVVSLMFRTSHRSVVQMREPMLACE